jgi:hypothetical protein
MGEGKGDRYAGNYFASVRNFLRKSLDSRSMFRRKRIVGRTKKVTGKKSQLRY